MTPELVLDWSLAVAAVAGALLVVIMVAEAAISFVVDLVEDTREWLHRT